MLYTSELTGKSYKTVKELEIAEDEYNKAHEAELKAKAERKARAEEVDVAYKHAMEVRTKCSKEIQEADKAYIDLRNKFIRDYGSYHSTFTVVDNWNNLFNDLINFSFLK